MSVGPDVSVAAAMMKGKYLDLQWKFWEYVPERNLWVHKTDKGMDMWRDHATMAQAIRDENP